MVLLQLCKTHSQINTLLNWATNRKKTQQIPTDNSSDKYLLLLRQELYQIKVKRHLQFIKHQAWCLIVTDACGNWKVLHAVVRVIIKLVLYSLDAAKPQHLKTACQYALSQHAVWAPCQTFIFSMCTTSWRTPTMTSLNYRQHSHLHPIRLT